MLVLGEVQVLRRLLVPALGRFGAMGQDLLLFCHGRMVVEHAA